MRFFTFLFLTVNYLHCSTSFTTLTIFELAREILEIGQSVIDISELDSSQDIEIFDKLYNLIIKTRELSDSLGESVMQKQFQNERLFSIDHNFKKMEKYVREHKKYEITTLIEFSNQLISTKNELINLTSLIDQNSNSLKEIHSNPKVYVCKEKQSLVQVVQNFLNKILIINIKNFVGIQGAYMFNKVYQKGNVTEDLTVTLRKFYEITSKVLDIFRTHTSTVSFELRRCEPEKHVEDITFLQITNFLHSFIINKKYLDPEGSCKSKCNTYKHVQKTQCDDDELCKKERTCPEIVSCHYVDQSMTVYLLDMKQTNRRYHHIEFEKNLTYGKKNSFLSSSVFLETFHSKSLDKCSYCFCVCDEERNYFSDRYINMCLTLSNIKENKVVTGLRFVKYNSIIHLQVQEGKVMEFGKIDRDTVNWVPLHNYSISDKNIRAGRDYHTLSWSEREFQLENIMADNGYVITGVKFSKVQNRLYLEALSTKYDFTTGVLTASHFQENKKLFFTHKFGKELKLTNPDIPTLSTFSDIITTNKYVKFTHSDFEKDAGQTTVPFFDAQPVESSTPVPLSGVGVFHRGREGYGGFIAPRIFTYNFTQHL